jgi:hypothetical protein
MKEGRIVQAAFIPGALRHAIHRFSIPSHRITK